jgi:hypothetical protein
MQLQAGKAHTMVEIVLLLVVWLLVGCVAARIIGNFAG